MTECQQLNVMLTEQVAQYARTSYVFETSIDLTLADLMLDTTKLTMCNHYCLTIYLVTEQNERNEYELELNNIQWIVDSGCTRHTCSQKKCFYNYGTAPCNDANC